MVREGGKEGGQKERGNRNGWNRKTNDGKPLRGEEVAWRRERRKRNLEEEGKESDKYG